MPCIHFIIFEPNLTIDLHLTTNLTNNSQIPASTVLKSKIRNMQKYSHRHGELGGNNGAAYSGLFL